MNENRKRGIIKNKILTVIAIASLISGGGKALASGIDSEGSLHVTEQMQLYTARGIVADQNGEPIIGASILEKGTANGIITDKDGKFSLNVKKGAILVISYIGYKTQEVKAGTNMNITLLEDAELLDEVVVIGYGVQKKKLVTGATVQVKGEDIAKLNTIDVLGALQSQSPGVNITSNGGFLGQGFKVNIRGIGTNGSYSPLYVVDGVVNGSIDGLSPADIESIDVLKDAASSAIYGSRAANGVILVTTKQGKEGRFEMSYDGYYGIQNLPKIATLLNAREYMMIEDEMHMMDGTPLLNWEKWLPAADYKAIQEGTWNGTNWVKEILNNDAPIQSHSFNFSGGTDRSDFSLGFTYFNQEATMGAPDRVAAMDRYNVRINSNHVVKKIGNLDFLKIGETVNYKFQQTTGSFATGDIYWNGTRDMLTTTPLMHAYNSKGEYYLYDDAQEEGYGENTTNPIAYQDYYTSHALSKSHYLQSSFYAELQPIKNLRIKSQFGYILSASSYRSYIPSYRPLSQSLTTQDDRVTQSMSLNQRWSWENTANYIFNVKDHQIDVLVGQSIEKYGMGDSMSANAEGSEFTDFEHAYLSNIKYDDKNKIKSLTGKPGSAGQMASFFGRINYNYKEKYMASFIMRADGSSIFSRGNRWGYFPSFSAGWVATNESFMSKLSWLDFLKIRASWGQNGNNAVNTFEYISRITSNNGSGGYSFGDSMDQVSIGSYAYKLTNPDLSWETQEQLNIGIDARFFSNRLALELDWYRRLTKDWLITPPVLYSFGSSPAAVNGGNIRNTGFEIGLHWNDHIGKDWNYGINLAPAFNKNKITKLPNEDGVLHGPSGNLWNGSDECARGEIGKPIGYFFGYKSLGIFQNQKQIDEYKGAKINGAQTQPGDVIWADINGDNVIDTEDRTEIGNPHPDMTLGFSFNVSWRMIDLSVTTYGAFGQQILKCYRDYTSSPLQNFTTDILERWHGEGTSNKLPRLSSTGGSNWSKVSDIYIEDGDYLKIKNITIGVDFKKIFRRIPLQQLRLYATVQNLYTFTGYSGMDPEIGYGSDYSWVQGIDLGYYPEARTCMIGLNVKF